MPSNRSLPGAPSKTVRLDEIKSHGPVKEKVLICGQVTPSEVVRCAVDHKATQVIQESNPYFQYQLDSAYEMLENPPYFLDFPIATILEPNSVGAEAEKRLKLAEFTFRSSHEKYKILDQITAAVSPLARPSSLAHDVKLVADELFTNALYNAPLEPDSPKADRSQMTELPQGKTARLVLGRKESRLVLLCEDVYGSLDISNYLSRMLKCYDEGLSNVMNWGTGGAGIGCYMIFESCMSIYLGVRPNEKTIVACVFAMGKGTRARQEMCKSIHYTQIEQETR